MMLIDNKKKTRVLEIRIVRCISVKLIIELFKKNLLGIKVLNIEYRMINKLTRTCRFSTKNRLIMRHHNQQLKFT